MEGTSLRSIFAKAVTTQFAEGYIGPEELGSANENMQLAVKESG